MVEVISWYEVLHAAENSGKNKVRIKKRYLVSQMYRILLLKNIQG